MQQPAQAQITRKRYVTHCHQCPYDQDPKTLTGFRKFRTELHLTLENPTYSTTARAISLWIVTLIFVSTVCVFCCLHTPQQYNNNNKNTNEQHTTRHTINKQPTQAAFCLESVDSIGDNVTNAWNYIEIVVVANFTAEYVWFVVLLV